VFLIFFSSEIYLVYGFYMVTSDTCLLPPLIKVAMMLHDVSYYSDTQLFSIVDYDYYHMCKHSDKGAPG
jgi:hypothetical protein